ncbi:MAG: hypothetical protein IAE80_16930 [Anaerolinea sp.]|nr:hypothetical protein [Anaerolinea sp.]
MVEQERVLNAIYRAIDEINRQLPADKKLSKTPETALYTKSGVLDSLAFVNLILATEDSVADEFGVAISIADKVAAKSETNPFRSVGTLADYITGQLEGQTNGHEAF